MNTSEDEAILWDAYEHPNIHWTCHTDIHTNITVYFDPIIMSMSVLGNLLTTVIILRNQYARKTAAGICVTVTSFARTFATVARLLPSWLAMTFGYHHFYYSGCRWLYFVDHMSMYLFTYFLLALSVERMLSVRRLTFASTGSCMPCPFTSTTTAVVTTSGFIVFVSVVVNASLIPNEHCIHPFDVLWFSFVVECLLPLCLIVATTVSTILALRMRRRSAGDGDDSASGNIQRHAVYARFENTVDDDETMTLPADPTSVEVLSPRRVDRMLTTVTVASSSLFVGWALMCVVFHILYFVGYVVGAYDAISTCIIEFVDSVTFSVAEFFTAVSFVVYCLASSDFRSELIALFRAVAVGLDRCRSSACRRRPAEEMHEDVDDLATREEAQWTVETSVDQIVLVQ